jgi:hypothetical protein
MSPKARAPHSGLIRLMNAPRDWNVERRPCKSGDETACIRVPPSLGWVLNLSLAEGVGAGTSVRPGRGRNRTKTDLENKIKKPAEDVRKKSPPARKAPARGRYVDEYARAPAC